MAVQHTARPRGSSALAPVVVVMAEVGEGDITVEEDMGGFSAVAMEAGAVGEWI